MIDLTSERRTSERQSAVTRRARVEWWMAGELHESAGRLVNFSEMGALLLADTLPPLHQTAWVRLDDPSPTDWIKTRVVRHSGMHEFAVDFTSPCFLDFTLAATLGLDFDSFFCVPRS